MEGFEKVSISESVNMEIQAEEKQENEGSKIDTTNEAILGLLRRFLAVQQRRALAYARLKRYSPSLSLSPNSPQFHTFCVCVALQAVFLECGESRLFSFYYCDVSNMSDSCTVRKFGCFLWLRLSL